MAIVGVGWNGTRDDINGFIERHGLTFTNVHDEDGSIFSSFGVAGQPAWVFQGANGVREIVIGAPSSAEVDSRLRAIAAPE